MNTKELQYKRLIREYDLKRTAKTQASLKRTAEVYKKVPQIEAIDKELSQTGINLVRQMLNKSKTDSTLEDFHKHSDDLLLTKKMLLVEAGFPPDYLEIHYDCPICKDTGFVGNKTCTCFKQGLINMAYEQSNLKNILSLENFSNFNIEYYSKEEMEGQPYSPYHNMTLIYQICVGFIEKFDFEKRNLLFYGSAGLGKTFLCNCIAKELLDKGYTVLYLTAPQLFKLFDEARFHREDLGDDSKDILETLRSTDLLIIDDLGTESSNAPSISEFFDVLNARYLNQLSTIISTNLAPNEWSNYYSDRIISRIFGNYTTLKFYGQDIRLLKKYSQK